MKRNVLVDLENFFVKAQMFVPDATSLQWEMLAVIKKINSSADASQLPYLTKYKSFLDFR